MIVETSCSLVWTNNSEFNNYNDSSNLTLKTNCSHAEFTYYSFKDGWQPLNEFEPAADQSISYTNHSTNRESIDIMTNTCVYHINIHMTEEKHEHLQGVVFIRSRDPAYNYCYPFPQRYNISTLQSECNCNQETTTTSADPSQETSTTEQTTVTESTEEITKQNLITTTASAKETIEQTTATASAEQTTERTTATASAEGSIEQTTATASTYLDQETTSSSCKVIVERMLLLFCSLICLIFLL